MHRFLIKDGQGFERDFGAGSHNAAAFAKKNVGSSAVIALHGNDSYWMLPEHVEYFSRTIGKMKVVSTAVKMLAEKAEAKATADREYLNWLTTNKTDGRKAKHKKFGLGDIVGESEEAFTIVFPGQKKELRVAKNFVDVVA